jgi:hypothetical protein
MWQNPVMARRVTTDFERHCVERIAADEGLAGVELAAFAALIAARERDGHRLLGPYAGPDAPFDTVTGRCGVGAVTFAR